MLATIKISAIIIVSWFWYEMFFSWIFKTFLNYTTDKLILSLWNWRAYFILRNYLAWTCFSINHLEGKHAKYDGWRTCIFMEEILILLSKIYYSYKSYKYLNMKTANAAKNKVSTSIAFRTKYWIKQPSHLIMCMKKGT